MYVWHGVQTCAHVRARARVCVCAHHATNRTSIAVLIGGCVLIRMGKGYVVTWSWTLVYVIAQAFVSAVAGVANEFLYVVVVVGR